MFWEVNEMKLLVVNKFKFWVLCVLECFLLLDVLDKEFCFKYIFLVGKYDYLGFRKYFDYYLWELEKEY